MAIDLNNNSFNCSFVEIERLADLNLSPLNNPTIINTTSQNNSLLTEEILNLSINDSLTKSAPNIKSNKSNLVINSSLNAKNTNSQQAVKKKLPSQSTSRLTNLDQTSFTIQSPEQIFQANKSTRQKENDRVKQLLRNNYWPTNHPIRKNLWKIILQQSQSTNYEKENTLKTNYWTANEVEYNRNLNQLFGKSEDITMSLPDFVYSSPTPNNSSLTPTNSTSNNHFNYYFLNNKGKQAIKRILSVYEYQYPHVTYSPGLVSISSLLLHYMQEHEVFSALCFLSSTKDHLVESKTSWETTCLVFLKLAKNYCKSSFDLISKYATEPLDTIFSEWFWWIFDSLSFDQLISFSIRNLKRSFIKELYLKVETKRKSLVNSFNSPGQNSHRFFTTAQNNNNALNNLTDPNNNIEFNDLTKPSLLENDTSFNLNSNTNNNNNSNSPSRIFLKETSTGILSHSNSSETKNYFVGSFRDKHLTVNENTKTRRSIGEMPSQKWTLFFSNTKLMKNSILSVYDLVTIWNWIPQRLSVYSPKTLFTTQENGTSLNTLFNVLDDLEYSLLVIKTFQNEIFGAFCSCDWKERKQKSLYFGNGETFLFSLAPEKNIFRWIGSKRQKVMAHQEMFIRADSKKIAIGGGSKDGLSINSNLIEGTTSQCDTFENEPLSVNSHFQIAILEVVGFES